MAAVVVGEEHVGDAGQAAAASPTSVRRWTKWIAELAEVGALHAVAAQVDPRVAPVSTASRSRVVTVLDAFELLGSALVDVGLTMIERTGLGRVLGWQHREHGVVLGLVAAPKRFSPAMASGGRLPSR